MRSYRHMHGPSTTRSRVRLALEALDLRLSPSSLIGTIADDPVLPPPDPAPPIVAPPTDGGGSVLFIVGAGRVDAAPQLVNFTAVAVAGGLWRFTGDVIDEAPGGLLISFGGEPVSLQGATTTTDANGHFDITLLLHTDGSDNGLASAQTVDVVGQSSNVALYNISPG